MCVTNVWYSTVPIPYAGVDMAVCGSEWQSAVEGPHMGNAAKFGGCYVCLYMALFLQQPRPRGTGFGTH